MALRNDKGFTLVEVIVVAAIIAILAGILVPMIFSQIDEAKTSRARADVRAISSAFFSFRKDVGVWPKSTVAFACDSTMLISDGPGFTPAIRAALENKGYNIDDTKTFSSQLMNNPGNGCYNNWKGPYHGSIELDPWGNPYLVDTFNINVDGVPALILSAGPDGNFDTAANDATVHDNDIGIRLK